MNVWICPPVAAVDSVKEARLVGELFPRRRCVRGSLHVAEALGSRGTWPRLSAACLLAACVGQNQPANTALSLSLKHTDT